MQNAHWITYTPSAPAHGAARKWVRNRNVWALLVPAEVERPTCIRDPRILASKNFASEVDSRYDGPNSSYGKAIAECRAFVEQRNQVVAAC